MKEKWEQLFDDDGNLLYEGFTFNHKPSGAGTAYFRNGAKYQEGVFGIKGLLVGREYYSNGQLRFEGVYRLNRAYGPNPPVLGSFFDENGKLLHEGEAVWKYGGVGYPYGVNVKNFGKVHQDGKPLLPCLMWEEARNDGRESSATQEKAADEQKP